MEQIENEQHYINAKNLIFHLTKVCRNNLWIPQELIEQLCYYYDTLTHTNAKDYILKMEEMCHHIQDLRMIPIRATIKSSFQLMMMSVISLSSYGINQWIQSPYINYFTITSTGIAALGIISIILHTNF